MGGSPPKGPDPVKTAGAQTGMNIGTAVANQQLGHTNQYTPYGNSTWEQTGSSSWTDPVSGKSYDLPQWANTQTLSPEQQQLQNQQTRAGTNTARLAADQSARLGGILGKPMDFSGAPQVGAVDFQTVGQGPNLLSGYGDKAGYAEQRQKVEDALMSRMNPQLQQEKQSLQSRLANQGLAPGSQAYNDAYDAYGRQANDARMGAVLAGGQEQSRLAGLDQQLAMFKNNSRQQQWENSLAGRGFNNDVRQQMLGNDRANRGDYMNEMYAARNQPINEIAALLGTGGVQQPSFAAQQGGGIPTTDFASIQDAAYKRRVAGQGQNPMLGGLFGLANTALGAVL